METLRSWPGVSLVKRSNYLFLCFEADYPKELLPDLGLRHAFYLYEGRTYYGISSFAFSEPGLTNEHLRVYDAEEDLIGIFNDHNLLLHL